MWQPYFCFKTWHVDSESGRISHNYWERKGPKVRTPKQAWRGVAAIIHSPTFDNWISGNSRCTDYGIERVEEHT